MRFFLTFIRSYELKEESYPREEFCHGLNRFASTRPPHSFHPPSTPPYLNFPIMSNIFIRSMASEKTLDRFWLVALW